MQDGKIRQAGVPDEWLRASLRMEAQRRQPRSRKGTATAEEDSQLLTALESLRLPALETQRLTAVEPYRHC